MILKHKLVIAISSRALFNLDEEHKLFEESIEKYEEHQFNNIDTPLQKGHAFNFIEKLLRLNATHNINGEIIEAVEVIVISQNSFTTGRRIKNAINHYDLPINRLIFTSGDCPSPYIKNCDLNIHLFLSHNKKAVKWALEDGIPAAIMMSGEQIVDDNEIRIAFDGDAVLFDDESEKIYQTNGLAAFNKNEIDNATTPLADGPFRKLFESFGELLKHFPKLIKIGLFTARSAETAERVLNSFDNWGLHPTHGAFLGGVTKRNFVSAFKADLFIDDHPKHCSAAKDFVSTAHVPAGGANED